VTKASDNIFPQVILDGVTADAAAPTNDNWKLYAKANGIFARSSNTIVGPFGAGGSGDVASDAIWDAKGDLAAGTGANTAQKLTVGANGLALIADSVETTGLKWADPGVVPWAILPYGGATHSLYLAWGASNRAIYVPCVIPAACTVTGIRIRIGTSSGNICVGLYDSGGTRVATSGSVASPGTSFRTINFTSSYAAAAGRYYLAMSADNTTITVSSPDAGGVVGSLTTRFEATAHPLPATASFSNDANNYNLVGVVSGGYPS
jgi:hypothetical protein